MPNSAASQPLFLYSTTVSDVGTVRSEQSGFLLSPASI